MYAIENPLGRFEGESEKEAKKLLRAAQRAKIKADQVFNANEAIAKDRARGIAYGFLCRLVSNEGCPSGWRYYRHGERYCAKAVIENPVVAASFYFSNVTADTAWGVVEVCGISSKFIGSVMDGAGHDCLLVFEERGGVLLWYAVGSSNGVFGLVDVPGLSIEWFNKGVQ